MKVLVVDESDAISRIITNYMKNIGYLEADYLYSKDGNQAIDMILAEHPDLVIVDQFAPFLSGAKLIKTLRAQGNEAKFILISVESDSTLVEELNQLGGAVFLKKPFTESELKIAASNLFQTEKSELDHRVQQLQNSLDQTIAGLNRLMKGLAGEQFDITNRNFDASDLSVPPFYACSMQNNNKINFVIYLDVNTANIFASIIRQKAALHASDEIKHRRIDSETMKVLLAFSTIFCSLYRAPQEDETISIHKEILVDTTPSRILEYAAHPQSISFSYKVQLQPDLFGVMVFSYIK